MSDNVIVQFQKEHREWSNENFPGQTGWQPILGMQEELGELCHAFLKASQGIRGYDDPIKAEEEMKDAVGDLFVYMMSFANTQGWSLADIIEEVWTGVKQRNWIEDPEGGNA